MADKPRPLSIAPAADTPPEDRGRAMLPAEVAREVFDGKVSGKWVRENAPLALRGRFGRCIVYRERDMIAWRESLFGQGAR